MTTTEITSTAAEDAVYSLDSAVAYLDQIYFDDVMDPNVDLLEEALEDLGRLADALSIMVDQDGIPPSLAFRLRGLRMCV